MAHIPQQFIGAWQLKDWRIEYSGGKISRPFGIDALGLLQYTPDGMMSATVSRANRPKSGLVNARSASDAQKSEAFDSYFHYAGPWHLDGESVVHTVTMSLNANMCGTQQVRKAEFAGPGFLTLSAVEQMSDTNSRHHILEWTKVWL